MRPNPRKQRNTTTPKMPPTMAPVLSLLPFVVLATLGTTDTVARGLKDGLEVNVDGSPVVGSGRDKDERVAPEDAFVEAIEPDEDGVSVGVVNWARRC